MAQHPVALSWGWFNPDESPNTDGVLWHDMVKNPGTDNEPTRILIDRLHAKEAQIVRARSGDISYLVETVVAPYDDERMLAELTESHAKLLIMLNGVLEISDARELSEMAKIIDIHGFRLFEWIEEYQIDHENGGHHKTSFKAFVNGIRYLVFYKLAGGGGDKTRVTFDMYHRLTSVTVSAVWDEWGAILDRGDASEAEAKAFSDMIRHGVTWERIERLQAIDYIIEE